MFFGRSKELEERVAQLEQELREARANAEQELQAEREKCAELQTQVQTLNASREELEAERARYEETIEELKRQSEEALDEERTRSNDALIALREHIYADKEDLMNRSEKELSVQTLMALGGFGTRMERLERRYADLLKAVNTEVISVISAQSESILGHFRDAKSEMIDAFAQQSEAMRTDYGKVNEEALQALSADTQTVAQSFRENTAQMLEELAQKTEALRGDYGRINDETTQALTADSQAVVNSFQEKTAQMLTELTQQSSAMRSDYGRINDEATRSLSANSQAMVNTFQEKTTQMAAMVDSLKKEISQAAKNAVDAVAAVHNPFEDSALSAKMNGIEQDMTSLKALIKGLAQDDIRNGLVSVLDKIEALSGKVEGLCAGGEPSEKKEGIVSDGAEVAGETIPEEKDPVDSEEPMENE